MIERLLLGSLEYFLNSFIDDSIAGDCRFQAVSGGWISVATAFARLIAAGARVLAGLFLLHVSGYSCGAGVAHGDMSGLIFTEWRQMLMVARLRLKAYRASLASCCLPGGAVGGKSLLSGDGIFGISVCRWHCCRKSCSIC